MRDFNHAEAFQIPRALALFLLAAPFCCILGFLGFLFHVFLQVMDRFGFVEIDNALVRLQEGHLS